MLSILLIPAALCYTFGEMVGDTRQGWACSPRCSSSSCRCSSLCVVGRAARQPALAALGVDQTASALQSGGNMEGKEVRFGIANSALWATATTAASNGSVNSMHDSFTPLGGLVPMWLMQLGEVVFGGVGSGLYGMLIFAIVAVFVAGLMVGRTPEYLGKKIEAYEMKMASLVILIPPLRRARSAPRSRSCAPAGTATIFNPGAARLQRGALRVLVGRQQQRQRLRRPRRQHAVLQHCARRSRCSFARYWLADPDARDRRLAGAQEDRARRARHAADAHAAVRRAARRRRSCSSAR